MGRRKKNTIIATKKMENSQLIQTENVTIHMKKKWEDCKTLLSRQKKMENVRPFSAPKTPNFSSSQNITVNWFKHNDRDFRTKELFPPTLYYSAVGVYTPTFSAVSLPSVKSWPGNQWADYRHFQSRRIYQLKQNF